MYNWERHAAENLTNANRMQESRKRIDPEHQNNLRRRERDRADAKQEKRRDRTISPLPRSNKFKARTYDRPWSQAPSATNKSSIPKKTVLPEKRTLVNKDTVSRLPAISIGTKSRAIDQASFSKTPHRVYEPLTLNGEGSLWCRKNRSVDMTNAASKLFHGEGSFTRKRTQSQDTLKGKTQKKALCGRLDRSNCSTKEKVCTLETHSVPQHRTSPGKSRTNLPHIPALQYIPPSPENDLILRLIPDAFDGSSEDGSVEEEIVNNDGTYRDLSRSSADTAVSSVQEAISPECPSSMRTLDETSPRGSFVASLSHRFQAMDVLSSESDVEDNDLTFPSWLNGDRDNYYIPVLWTGSQSSSPNISPPQHPCTPTALSWLSTESICPDISSGTLALDRNSPMPSLELVGEVHIAALPSATSNLVNRGTMTTRPQHIDQQLPELELVNSRSAQPSWLGSESRPEALTRISFPRRDSLFVNRLEEPEDAEGAPSSHSREDTLSAVQSPMTSNYIIDHMTSALMLLNDIRRHLVVHHVHNANDIGRGALSQGTAPPEPATSPETLRRIKERLLEESSDEDEGDLCRICQAGIGSPTNPLLTPCQCSGSLQYIHHDCLKKWIETKIQSGSELSDVRTCELCKESLNLDLDNFDLEVVYQRHRQQEVVARPELHMVMLLHQRYSDLLQLAQSRRNTVSRVRGTDNSTMATRLYLIDGATGTTNLDAPSPGQHTEGENQPREAETQ